MASEYDYDDFSTQIQSDECIPAEFEDDAWREPPTDEAALYGEWREDCFDCAEAADEDELVAVFGADDPDNYFGEDDWYGGEAADEDSRA